MSSFRSKENIKPYTSERLNLLGIGCLLLIAFVISTVYFAAGYVAMLSKTGFVEIIKSGWQRILLIILGENLLFWPGIIMVYLTSGQLKFKLRLIGILCGMIPIAHLIALYFILKTAVSEVLFEKRKMRLDKKRAGEQVCRTKYPLLMVHGVFFRDFKYFNYWGRVPEELEKNGATIFYGNHQSAASVENSAKELAERIRGIVEETGCGKLNIIAHSKGGLDIKTAIAQEKVADLVASVTTVNTPHRGCEFAEYLMGKAPAGLKDSVAKAYNTALKKMGDENPDFIAAVTDLTASRTRELSDRADSFDFKGSGIYTQSIGSCMKKATSGAFPLNMSYHLVGWFDGRNDGLVGEGSFKWGEDYTFLENKKTRGISHGDMIDLNRENIPGFDVREFYVKLVSDLKNKGL